MSNSHTHSVAAAPRQSPCGSVQRNNLINYLDSEHGGTRLNLLIVVFIISVIGYGVASYAPTVYKAMEYKDVMQSKVDQAAAFGRTGEWVSAQLRASAAEYDVPPDASITAGVRDRRMVAVVQYTQPIVLPGIVYDYEFEHTVRSTNILGK